MDYYGLKSVIIKLVIKKGMKQVSEKREKAVFLKELLNNFMEENNEKWINEYRKNTDYDEGYYQALENFFKFKKYTQKPFS